MESIHNKLPPRKMERPMTGKAGDRPATALAALDKDHKQLYDGDPNAAKTIPSLYDKESDMPVAMESESFDKDGSIRVNQRHKDQENVPQGCWYKFKHAIRSIWMTKQTEDTEYDRELYIKTTLRELIIYVLFLVVLCILTFGMTSSNMYYFTSVLMNLFVFTDAQPPTGQTFAAAGQINDFWTFAKGPMLDGLYWEQWYNNQNVSNDQLGYIFYENKLLGRPQLRMVKVKENSCKIHHSMAHVVNFCYAPYSHGHEDTQTFGPNGSFPYYSQKQLDGSSHWGKISSYSGGGYIARLASTKEKSRDIVNYLSDNLWINRATRAVFLDFTVYNANINLFSVIKMIIEFPASGGAFPSWTFRTVKLIRYVTSFDYFVMGCEIFFCLFIAYYIIEEAIEIHKHGWRYFCAFWNVLDVVVIIIAICCIIFSVVRTLLVDDTLTKLLEDPNSFANFEFLSFAQIQYSNALAVMVFFAWVKIFKYISFNKTMSQLSSTLSRCAKDVGGFAVMFFIFFFAYAQLGYLLFGTVAQDYSSFSTAAFTLLRLILGDFDFKSLQMANRVMGPIYFITFVFFVFFVLLNMFLAIINDTYGEVKAELASQRNEFEIGDYFKQNYMNVMRKLHLKKDRLVDIQHALHGADSNADKHVDFDEWRQQLKKRGYAEQEIEGMFARYDMDGDRNLDTEEQNTLKSELDGQAKAVDNEMKNANNRPMSARSEFQDFDNPAGHEGHRRRHHGGGGGNGDGITNDEFSVLTRRVDRMEHAIGSIVNKIDAVLVKLENMETLKKQHQDEMRKIMDQINRMDATDDEKREKMEDLAKVGQKGQRPGSTASRRPGSSSSTH